MSAVAPMSEPCIALTYQRNLQINIAGRCRRLATFAVEFCAKADPTVTFSGTYCGQHLTRIERDGGQWFRVRNRLWEMRIVSKTRLAGGQRIKAEVGA